MADIHPPPGPGQQMPQAANSGPAPAPYQGVNQGPEPPDYSADLGPMGDAAGEVMNGIPAMASVTESAAAHSIPAGLADAPYAPGSTSPIYTGGDDDAGGRDDVGGSVAEAVANATARWRENQSYTLQQGGTAGDLVTFPPSPLDPGVGVGNTIPTGGFYDPDRNYGGEQGAPGYQGEAQ